jgi:tetratricopeptide (TPR) repeat protein
MPEERNMRKTVGMCLLLLAITACSTKRSYLEKGNTFFQQGKYQDAAINYRKAIQKDPNYGEAYYRLGLAAIREANALEAYNSLFRASQLLPNNVEVKEKFAGLCLEYYLRDPNRPQKLYQQIQQLSSELLARNPRSFEGLRLRGYLAREDRKPADAISYLQRALQARPGDAQVTTILVQTLMETGQSQEAEKMALELVAKEKTYAPAYDVLYAYYYNANRLADAENILKLKVANNPKQAGYLVQLAGHYARVQKPAEEKAALQKLLDDPKDFPDGQLRAGDFYLAEKDYPEALRHYEAAERNDPKNKAGVDKRALAAMLAASKYDDASHLADQILKTQPKDEVAVRMRADLLIDTEKPENAQRALQLLQSLVTPNERDAGLRLQLGRAYLLKGDLGAARGQFEEALRLRKDFPAAQYELAEVDLQQQRPAEALQAANAVVALQPSNRRARLLQARSLAGTGDAAKARALFLQLMKESPKETEPRLRLGLLDVQQGNYQEAIDVLEELRDTGNPTAVVGLSVAYTKRRQFDKAMVVLGDGLKQSPGSTMIQVQLAETTARTGNLDLAITRFQQLIAQEPKSAQLKLRLAEVYEVKGDKKNALLLYQQAHDAAPGEAGPSLVLADALARAGRTDEARALYHTIVASHPENLPALNNAAFFLSENGGDLNEALRLVSKALEKAPGQPGFSDTLGYVYLKKGERDNAIKTFSDLVRRYPNFAVFHYHLGLALYEKGDQAAAKKELQKAMADHPSASIMPRIKELLGKIS